MNKLYKIDKAVKAHFDDPKVYKKVNALFTESLLSNEKEKRDLKNRVDKAIKEVLPLLTRKELEKKLTKYLQDSYY